MDEKRINYKPDMPSAGADSKFLRFLGILIIVICVASLSFAGGRIFEQRTEYPHLNNFESFSREDFDSSLFWDVWNILEREYVDEEAIDREKMFYGAIKGMVSSLEDPATIFLNAEESETFRKQTEGKHFEGIGAELGYRDGVIIIIDRKSVV